MAPSRRLRRKCRGRRALAQPTGAGVARRAMDLSALIRDCLPAARAAWLFGSRVRGDARPDSDTDLAVLLDAPPPLRQWRALMDAAALATGTDVHLVDLRRASVDLQAEVGVEGVRLFGDDEACEAFEAGVLSTLAHLNDTRADVRAALRRWRPSRVATQVATTRVAVTAP